MIDFIGMEDINMANQRNIKCDNCKKCKYPCVNSGEGLKPITIEELRDIGFVLCEDYTEKEI